MARTEIITVLPEGATRQELESVLAEIEQVVPSAEIRYTEDGRNWQMSRAGQSTPIPMGEQTNRQSDEAPAKSKR